MIAPAFRPAALSVSPARARVGQAFWRYGAVPRPDWRVRERSADYGPVTGIEPSAQPAAEAQRRAPGDCQGPPTAEMRPARQPAPETCLAPRPGAVAPLHEALLGAFHRIRLAEARVTRVEAREIHDLRRTRAHAALGFSSFADLAREMLQMSPRNAHQRATLHETLAAWPAIEEAFLAGSMTACQALAIRPALAPETVPFWIGLSRQLTVEQLRRRVQEMLAGAGVSVADSMIDPDPPGDVISFDAPHAVVVAWEDAMEMARRVLGRQAPRYECVEALLSEAGVPPGQPGELPPGDPESVPPGREAAAPTPPDQPAGPGPDAPGSPPTPDAPGSLPSPSVIARARLTLDLVARELDQLDDLIESAPCADAHARVARLTALHQLGRPLRVLTARLLRDLRDSGAMDHLGYGRLQDFVERHLRLSARTARALVAESLLFEDRPELEAAYATGRIGASQAIAIERNTSISRMADQIRRAEQLTCRQFTREMRFLERLASFAPALRARRPGPLPMPGLEDDLRVEIRQLGWTDEDIATGLLARGCAPEEAGGTAAAPRGAFQSPAPPTTHPIPAADICTPDPAEDPILMHRLETLVDLLALAADHPSNMKQIRFWAPLDIAAHWRAGIRHLRREAGNLPVWALVTILLMRSVRVWEQVDPGARPQGHRILERDGWRCQAPGCTARRALEIHHIRFRSCGGSNEAGNRITLCHAHHQHGVHAGVVRLQGRAPDNLQWEIGCRSGQPPLWTLRGERKIPKDPRRHF